jgi:signal transduction histidine kinase
VASTLPPGAKPVLSRREIAAARAGTVLLSGRDVPRIDTTARIRAQGARGYIVAAGVSEADREETLDGLQRAFAVATALALLLATGSGYLLAGRGLAPVDAMRRRAEQVTLERTGERLPLPPANDEIRHLGETLNAMLDRIEASLARERVFVADASHELRTPLAILRAELELAERPGRSPAEVRAALRSVAEEVARLARLAEDLLVIARSEEGHLAIATEQVDLRELLDRVAQRFIGAAKAAGRELSVAAAPGTAARIDPLRVEQALGNLVDNALQHGAGTVRLSARVEGEHAWIEVADAGSGFPDGFEDHAFERFTRAGGRAGEGAGLGLAIVQAIATAHDGSVVVASEPSGATVRLVLPLSRPSHPGPRT